MASPNTYRRKFYLGPYRNSVFAVFYFHKAHAFRLLITGDENKITLGQLTGHETIFKIPPGHTCVVVIEEVQDGRFTFDVHQLPVLVSKPDELSRLPLGFSGEEELSRCVLTECNPSERDDCELADVPYCDSSGAIQCGPPAGGDGMGAGECCPPQP